MCTPNLLIEPSLELKESLLKPQAHQRIASPKKRERNKMKIKFGHRQARRAELLMRQLVKTYGEKAMQNSFLAPDFVGQHPGRAILVTNGPAMWASTKRRTVAAIK